jgi:hypothetical protein
MLESMLTIGGGKKKIYPDSGPGPIAATGDDNVAYFGTVSNTELFSAAALAEQVVEMQGVPVTRDELPWHKFLYYGKIYFIKQYPIFYDSNPSSSATSWKRLYDAGLIYGEDNEGAYPMGNPVNQMRFIKKGAYNFKVRTITGDETSVPTLGISNGELDTKRRKSMFTELIYRLYHYPVPNYPERKFASFEYLDLISNNREVTREIIVNSSYPAGVAINRGLALSLEPYVAGYDAYPNRNTIVAGRPWRPVLELMTGKELFPLANPYSSVGGFMKGAVSNPQMTGSTDPDTLKMLIEYKTQSKNISYIGQTQYNVLGLGDSNLARIIEPKIQTTNIRYVSNPRVTVTNPT